jgi:hypothetical protein
MQSVLGASKIVRFFQSSLPILRFFAAKVHGPIHGSLFLKGS